MILTDKRQAWAATPLGTASGGKWRQQAQSLTKPSNRAARYTKHIPRNLCSLNIDVYRLRPVKTPDSWKLPYLGLYLASLTSSLQTASKAIQRSVIVQRPSPIRVPPVHFRSLLFSSLRRQHSLRSHERTLEQQHRALQATCRAAARNRPTAATHAGGGGSVGTLAAHVPRTSQLRARAAAAWRWQRRRRPAAAAQPASAHGAAAATTTAATAAAAAATRPAGALWPAAAACFPAARGPLLCL
jgi:hypothetical protein